MQEFNIKQTFIDGKNFTGKLQVSEYLLIFQLLVPSKQLSLIYEITNDKIQQNKGLFLLITNVDDLYSELTSQRHLEVDDRNRLVISAQGVYGDKKINHSVILEFTVVQFQSHLQQIQLMFKHLQEKLDFVNKRQNNRLFPVKQILFVGDNKNQYYPQYQIRENIYSLRPQGKAQVLLNHKDQMPKHGVHQFNFHLLQKESSNVSVGLCAMNIFQSTNPLTLKKLWVGLDLSHCQITHNEQKIKIGDIKFTKGSKCTMTVNMDLQQISWAIDGYQFAKIRFTDHLCHQRFYPFIAMKKISKPIQFLQK